MNSIDSTDQSFLDGLYKTIESNLLNEQFGVEGLAREIGVSRSQLHRKLHALTGHSASQLIREYRLNKAKDLLEKKAATVAEVSYQVGFGSPSYFNTCFHDFFGYPPGEVKIRKSLDDKKKPLITKKAAMISASILAVLVLIYYFVNLTIVGTDKIPKPVVLEKAIAVLPLKYLSEDPDKQYLANGILDDIIGHLSKIKDLRVTPRTTVEQYRETTKTARVIGEELNVSYLIEGSFFMLNDQIKLNIQLVTTEDEDHIWFEEYDRKLTELFAVESEIAQAIAKKIEVEIIPELKKLIESIPTENADAYQLYLQGKHHENIGKSGLQRAIRLYRQAIALDPNFAPAYSALGSATFNQGYISDYLKDDYGDSLVWYAEKAISLDSTLAAAYITLGWYYNWISDDDNSIYYLNKALEYYPNHPNVYRILGWVYGRMDQYENEIISFEKAKKLSVGSPLDISEMLAHIGGFYQKIGDFEKAENMFEEMLPIEPLRAYYHLGSHFTSIGEWDKMKFYTDKACGIDSGEMCLKMLNKYYLNKENFSSALKYADLHKETGRKLDEMRMFDQAEYGYILSQLNRKEEAKEYYYKQIDYCFKSLHLKRVWAIEGLADYVLFNTYTFLRENEKAIHHLKEMEKKGVGWGRFGYIQVAPQYKIHWKDKEFQAVIYRQEKKVADIRAEVDQLEKEGKL